MTVRQRWEKCVSIVLFSRTYNLCCHGKSEADDLSACQYNNACSPVQRVNTPCSQRALNPAWYQSTSLLPLLINMVVHLFILPAVVTLQQGPIIPDDQGPPSDAHFSRATTVLVLAEYCKYLNKVLWELLQCVQRRHVFSSVYFRNITTYVGALRSHPVLSGNKN